MYITSKKKISYYNIFILLRTSIIVSINPPNITNILLKLLPVPPAPSSPDKGPVGAEGPPPLEELLSSSSLSLLLLFDF